MSRRPSATTSSTSSPRRAQASERRSAPVRGAPFVLFAALGLLLMRRPQLEATVELAGDRALEGDELEVQVQLRADAGAERVEVLLELPRELVVEDGHNPVLLRLRDGERR